MRPKHNIIKLKKMTLSGFKSFNQDDHTIEFGDITVLIGANGSGKSNVVSFFKMIGYMMTGALQQYIGQLGGANSVLHFGAKTTSKLSAKLEFGNESYYDKYYFSLVHAAQDSLIFTHEILSFQDKKKYSQLRDIELPISGTKESGLKLDLPKLKDLTPIKIIYTLLKKCMVYQFHDTSATSKIRSSSYINQDDFLYSDGGNLPAFLYGMKENSTTYPYYQKIVRHVKQVFPHFRDFSLQPSSSNNNYILLDWFGDNVPEYKFGVHQLSDGTLRFIALTALLLQPPQNLPSVIVLDEPELGLHPFAITALASMIKIASRHAQVILATQSPALLDEFIPEQITVIEHDPKSNSSIFKKFTTEDLNYWMQDYTLSEIWNKNILGGNP